MATLPYYLSLILLTLLSYATEFSLNSTQTRFTSNDQITSGTHVIKGTATIPAMFIKPTIGQQTRRRLEEKTLSPTPPKTPAPTTKLMLPVIILIHPEGAQDRSVSLSGSQFNMNPSYEGKLFDDIATSLVNKGRMAVIQYDKRNCQYPLCRNTCPAACPSKLNSCDWITGVCYNDSNITINDITQDATNVFTNSITELKQYLNEDIVDFDRIWSIPIGFSSQGAAIATYIASRMNSHYNIWPTVISLMGSGIPIDSLLEIQLHNQLAQNINNSQTYINQMVNSLTHKFMMIKNGSLNDTQMIDIYNTFLNTNDTKYVSYWRNWLDLFFNTEYEKIENFMSINSYNDELIPVEAYEPLRNMFAENATVEMNVLQNINHYMIDNKYWKRGEWRVDEKVSAHIINFINDISGYLDDINEWIRLNHTNNSNQFTDEHILVENDTIYKVLLYMAIMTIILILALGMYCIIARKACPYEFEDVNIENAARDEERERERERRRRRRRRHHRRHRRSSNRNSNYTNMVELNEPILNPQHDDDDQNNGNDRQIQGNGIEEHIVNQQVENNDSILNQYVD